MDRPAPKAGGAAAAMGVGSVRPSAAEAAPQSAPAPDTRDRDDRRGERARGRDMVAQALKGGYPPGEGEGGTAQGSGGSKAHGRDPGIRGVESAKALGTTGRSDVDAQADAQANPKTLSSFDLGGGQTKSKAKDDVGGLSGIESVEEPSPFDASDFIDSAPAGAAAYGRAAGDAAPAPATPGSSPATSGH